jgi:hypothetical protein
MSEPVAYRYDFDGYGWLYIDSGSGSNFASLVAKNNGAEPLYTHPVAEQSSLSELTDQEIDEVYNSIPEIKGYAPIYEFARAIIKASRGEK